MPTAFETPESATSLRFDIADSVGLPKVSIAVIDTNREQCSSIVSQLSGARTGAVRAVPGYLPMNQDAQWLASQGFDMIFVGMDSDAREALRTIENLCALSPATVVAYSQQAGQDILIQAMRAGAREFLALPFAPGVVDQAITRVAIRIQAAPIQKNTAGKALVFVGAKGGAGVTTLACNFAVALAKEARQNTLLIDFDLPLGDAALSLGLNYEFSTVDALREAERMDPTFLSRLLVRHSSGLSLLAAPGRFPHVTVDDMAANRLLTVACNSFDCVVVDAGSRLDWTRTQLFDLASRIYLVTQVGIPELRNANRMITGSIPAYGSKLEIVLNRDASKTMGFDDEAIEFALTKAPQWRIPNDYFAVRDMQTRAEPLALENSPIARMIRKMAREACGLQQDEKKKGLLGLFH